jgi:DNA repair exonuclease SbcCD ATPase subunit
MSIYVISNDLNIKYNLFKVGRTKDTNAEIVTKYQRYLSGARLLLWYRSNLTNYVEDEREILRFFDSNRNRTPNGFKNEWLSISFEQLKTKMDEYFGHDGEEFEEEQKRERENRQKEREERRTEKEMIQFTCDFCNQNLSNSQSLKRHHTTCKKRTCFLIQENFQHQIQSLKEQYEQQIQSLKEQYEQQIQSLKVQHKQQIQSLKVQHEQQIQSLKEQLSEFKNQIFEIAKHPKQSTVTNNNNTNT